MSYFSGLDQVSKFDSAGAFNQKIPERRRKYCGDMGRPTHIPASPQKPMRRREEDLKV
jgi:hypothetical protein